VILKQSTITFNSVTYAVITIALVMCTIFINHHQHILPTSIY